MMVQIVIMVFYAVLISYSISVISQIVSAQDKSEAALAEKMEILDNIYHMCQLPLDLYTRLKHSLRYIYDKDSKNLNTFIEELPPNLREQTAIFIHEKTWSSIPFFDAASDSFITWICPLLKPLLVPE